jgi:hypothetical protein
VNTFLFSHHGSAYVGYLDTSKRYNDNNNMVCRLYAHPHGTEEEFELYAVLSVNTAVALPVGQFVFKTYSENAGLYEEMVRNGLIEPTICGVACGFAGQQPIVKLVEVPSAVTT